MISRVLIAFLAFCITFPANAQDMEQTGKVMPVNQTQLQLSFAPVVKKVAPAVVNIYTTRMVARSVSPFANDPFFSQFFGNNLPGQMMRKQAENALGSGVIIDASGLVVTNAHVIRGAEEITVGLADGREFSAKLALSDDASDLALLRIKSDTPLPFVTLGPSESLEVGDIVLAIGNPFGVGQTVTSGIVSAQGRSSLDINDFNFFIQTDAAINPGNSGGALVALNGNVVGINTAIYSRSGGSLGIGFAIPSEMLASVIAAEKSGASGVGGVVRPWLGITAQAVTSEIGESLNLKTPRGALVNSLHPASPLKAAGVKVGDVVIKVNDRIIRDPAEMKFRMANVPLGEHADMTIMRQGKEISVAVKAIAPPNDPPRNDTLLGEDANILSGATISNLNPAVAIEIGARWDDDKTAVIVLKVENGSQASRILQQGDIIVNINGMDITQVEDVKKALKSTNAQGVSLTINSNGQIKQIRMR